MYCPAEGFTYLRRVTASSACKADLFYFPFPADTVQCFQMNDAERNVCGFKNCPNWINTNIQNATNCYPASHFFIRLRDFAALLALNIQCPWLSAKKHDYVFPKGLQRNRKKAF